MRSSKIVEAERINQDVLGGIDYPVSLYSTGVCGRGYMGEEGIYEEFEFFVDQLRGDEIRYKIETVLDNFGFTIRVLEGEELIEETGEVSRAIEVLNGLLGASVERSFEKIVESRFKYTN